MRIASPLRWCATSKQALLTQNEVKWRKETGKFEIVGKEAVMKFSEEAALQCVCPDGRPKRSPDPPKHRSLFMEVSVSTECHLECHTV